MGRGWEVFDFPVQLEPILPPNISSRQNQRPVDDARVPSFFSRLLTSGKAEIPSRHQPFEPDNHLSPQPDNHPDIPVISFRVNLPNELKVSPEQSQALLLNLANSASFIGFEIVGASDSIGFQVTCPEAEKTAVYAQLQGHLPMVNFMESEDLLRKRLRLNKLSETVSVDFGLAREWFLPLPVGKNFVPDSLVPLIASFEQIKIGEIACLQVLFSSVRQNWQRAGQALLTDKKGKLIFTNHLGFSGVKEKLAQPLLAVGVRFVTQSNSRWRSMQIAKRATPFFRQLSTPDGNELIPLQAESLNKERHLSSFLSRKSYRAGALLCVSELASSLVHLPSDNVRCWKLNRGDPRTKPAPEFATRGNSVLGVNNHLGQSQTIKLSNEERMKHIWLLGASGSGKTSLITSLVERDMRSSDHGLCVIEPHGDLIEDIIARVPEHRVKDCILFDPAARFPIAFNFLKANSELEQTLLSSDLVAVFRQFSTSWGDVIETLLHNAILAFLCSTQGGTLVDLRNFLVDREFRDAFLRTVTDEEIRFFWQNEFPRMGGKPHVPLLTRIDTFLRSRLIRNIVAQKDSLDFRRIMDDKKILLVKLAHGAIGQEQSRMLGSLIMAKLYQAALSRQNIPEKERSDFFIYADEAHHFIVPSTSLLLSGGRKFHASLLFSNQETRQITSRDPEVLSSLLTNCFTRVCFRLDSDAELLSKGFSFFTAEHLKNLAVGETICRLEQSQYDFNLQTIPLERVDAVNALRRKREIVEQNCNTYATARDLIETNHSSIKDPTMDGIDDGNVNTRVQLAVEPKQNFGRAGQHHQDLQGVIKRVAETYGFRVTVEQGIGDGTGRVDVSLEKENLRIACEVSVTTTEYEIRNILKCLGDGYDHVIVVVSNQKKLPLINSKIQSGISIENQDKVKAFDLKGLLAFLRGIAKSKEPDQTRPEKPAGQRLNFAEACDFFDVAPSTLYRWVREGRVPFYRPGREFQFDRDELVLIGKHDLSGKRTASVKLPPLRIGKKTPNGKKEQDSRYRKLLKLD